MILIQDSSEKKGSEAAAEDQQREIAVMVGPAPDVPKPPGGRVAKRPALKIELHAESLRPATNAATSAQIKPYGTSATPKATSSTTNLHKL